MTAGLEEPVLVYDIGGSHISAAICVGDAYRLGRVVSAPHPPRQTCDAFLSALHALGVEASAGFQNVQGAALAVPGPFDFATGVSLMRHKLPYLYGIDLREKLADHFGWRPEQVRFLLDARAFLLGEIGAGAARGVARAAGITLGTGIGSAFAVNGCLVTEGHGVPPGGEIWNLPYREGIIEDSVSARAIRGSYERRTGVAREAVELAAAAAVDAAAAEAFAEFGRHLGIAMRGALASFAPEIVVLGGGICRSEQLFLPATRRELEDMNTQLRISKLLDDAALVGAGVAWFNGSHGLSRDLIGDSTQANAE
jgi:glucokinase